MDFYKNCILTIQCSLDGFSFAIKNVETAAFTKVGTIRSLAKIKELNIDTTDFQKVIAIIDNDESTIVPEQFYEDSKKRQYLDFLGLGNEMQILTEDVNAVNAVNIFAVPFEQLNEISNLNANIEIKHISTVFIGAVMNRFRESITAQIAVDVHDEHFEMVAAKGNILLMHNIFHFKTKEDFAYFLLFAMERLHLDGETTPLYFAGLIDEKSQIVELCSRYIRDIRFFRKDSKTKLAQDIEETPFYYNFTLFNSLI
ncbi:MAG: DUF3822 family protein [Bacteroidales bacterium]|nr:DUF3822 family protein [Bacteroidales bacterium]